MFERYENRLHAIRLELDDRKHPFAVVPVVGDVTDTVRVNAVLETYRPEIVFHAAAHKHVPLMEENPCEAIKNNVRGTRVLARAAEVHGVHRFIMISTDKGGKPVRQRPGQQRQRRAPLHGADCQGRPGDGDAPGRAPVLHADP